MIDNCIVIEWKKGEREWERGNHVDALSFVSCFLLESVTKIYELFHERLSLLRPWPLPHLRQNAFTCNHVKVLYYMETQNNGPTCLRALLAGVEGATIGRALLRVRLLRVRCLLHDNATCVIPYPSSLKVL